MRRKARPKREFSTATLARDLALVVAVCLAIRLVADLTSGAKAPDLPEKLGTAILSLELPFAKRGEGAGTSELIMSGELPGKLKLERTKTDTGVSGERAENEDPPEETGSDTQTEGPADGTGAPQTPDNVPETPSAPSEPEVALKDAIPTTIGGSGERFTGTAEGIFIKNKTEYTVDAEKLLAAALPFGSDAAVLIVHTHTSEAYNPTEEDNYTESDPSRTEDTRYSVVRVGDELAEVLEARGITVYHDRELHDYPSYTGSYGRSLASVQEYMAEHKDIKVVIDLHRDALEGDGKLYKTVANVGDTPCAQVMVLCGTNFSGLKHPDWQDNLNFALKLQRRMVDLYPTLARPLKLSPYRYNQHVAPGALIVEIGTNGNTLREAVTAARYFGECLADVLTGET